MGYDHIRPTEDAIHLCRIILPWMQYNYKHLSMGVRNLPDILQKKINDFPKYSNLPWVYRRTFDFEIFYWKYHVQKLKLTLNRLKYNGLKCNIEKYFLGKNEMEYLGFWVTGDGVKHLDKKCHK